MGVYYSGGFAVHALIPVEDICLTRPQGSTGVEDMARSTADGAILAKSDKGAK